MTLDAVTLRNLEIVRIYWWSIERYFVCRSKQKFNCRWFEKIEGLVTQTFTRFREK